jgi:hypothetical protein
MSRRVVRLSYVSSTRLRPEAEIGSFVPRIGVAARAGPFAGLIADDCQRGAGQRRTRPNDCRTVRGPRLRRSEGVVASRPYAGFCLGASAPWSGSRQRRPSLSAGGCPPAPAAYPGVSADGPSSPCVALLPVGFAEPPGSPRALVRSYRTVSPLPVRGRSGDRSRHRRFAFCGTFLRVAPTGCYPAPCPTESGRSSGRDAEASGTRPPGRLATISIVAPPRTGSHPNRGSVRAGVRR